VETIDDIERTPSIDWQEVNKIKSLSANKLINFKDGWSRPDCMDSICNNLMYRLEVVYTQIFKHGEL
jgi:hypothetical protein